MDQAPKQPAPGRQPGVNKYHTGRWAHLNIIHSRVHEERRELRGPTPDHRPRGVVYNLVFSKGLGVVGANTLCFHSVFYTAPAGVESSASKHLHRSPGMGYIWCLARPGDPCAPGSRGVAACPAHPSKGARATVLNPAIVLVDLPSMLLDLAIFWLDLEQILLDSRTILN